MFQLICEVKVILLLMCILCESKFGHFSAIFEDEMTKFSITYHYADEMVDILLYPNSRHYAR